MKGGAIPTIVYGPMMKTISIPISKSPRNYYGGFDGLRAVLTSVASIPIFTICQSEAIRSSFASSAVSSIDGEQFRIALMNFQTG